MIQLMSLTNPQCYEQRDQKIFSGVVWCGVVFCGVWSHLNPVTWLHRVHEFVVAVHECRERGRTVRDLIRRLLKLDHLLVGKLAPVVNELVGPASVVSRQQHGKVEKRTDSLRKWIERQATWPKSYKRG